MEVRDSWCVDDDVCVEMSLGESRVQWVGFRTCFERRSIVPQKAENMVNQLWWQHCGECTKVTPVTRF